MKKIISMILIAIMIIFLVGCSDDGQSMIDNSENNARFVLQESIGGDSIYVDTRTGVLYFVHKGGSNYPYMWGSVLMGADGLPLLAPGYERPAD